MEGGSYMSAVLLLAYKTCIQNYLEKIRNSSLSPPLSCFPTHPVSVKQDFGKYFGYSFRLFGHLILVWFRRWKSLSPQHIHRQSHRWNLKQPTIQLFVCVCLATEATWNLSLVSAQSKGYGQAQPTRSWCWEESWTSARQGLHWLREWKGPSGWRFPILLARLALFWIKLNHNKEKKIKSRFSWDGQHLYLSLGTRSYNIG